MHDIIGKYYATDSFYVVGNTTSAMDLSSSFGEDNLLISVLSALFVILVLLFTFKSAGLPVLLIIVIQAVSGSTSRCRTCSTPRCTSSAT